ncbi:MAG: hypothetical protein GY820_31180 [Gammaproteobacteria bacterium]|nr:hypothetical protein [Gammaproteobacteria bacterium]
MPVVQQRACRWFTAKMHHLSRRAQLKNPAAGVTRRKGKTPVNPRDASRRAFTFEMTSAELWTRQAAPKIIEPGTENHFQPPFPVEMQNYLPPVNTMFHHKCKRDAILNRVGYLPCGAIL